MRLDLTGKTALVSGSTQGIGRAIAAGLSAAGARVAVNGRDAAKVAKVVAELGDAVAAPGDLSTPEGTAGVLRIVPEVDILVNNLGIFGPTPALLRGQRAVGDGRLPELTPGVRDNRRGVALRRRLPECGPVLRPSGRG